MAVVTARTFETVASIMLSRCMKGRRFITGTFTNMFGISPQLTAIVWQRIKQNVPDDGEPKHLLWGLCFLRNYAVESVNEVISGVCRKTFRRWAWLTIKQMASMSLVSETKGRKYT